MQFILKVLLGIGIAIICSCAGGSASQTSACSALNAKVFNGESCNSNSRSPVVAFFPIAQDGSRIFAAGICSGVLVTQDDIITSAHCFIDPIKKFGKSILGFGVYVGGEKSGEGIGLIRAKLHPQYDGRAGSPFDIAIATLQQVPNPAINPVPIAVSEETIAGDGVTTFGYGTRNGGEVGELKAADMLIESKVSGNFIVTFARADASICPGDSGGPLVKAIQGQSALVGINSFVVQSDAGECGLHGSSVSGFVDIQSSSTLNFITSYAADVAVR